MPDERLDDAIDAVVRAVDRIERATRSQRLVTPPVVDGAPPAVDPDLLPPATNVAPGRSAWEPIDAGDRRERRKKDKGKKRKHAGRDDHPPLRDGRERFGVDEVEVTGQEAALAGDDPEPYLDDPVLPAPPAAQPAAFAHTLATAPTPAPGAAAPQAPAEVHELVGRIVARTQELDDHLEAARQLRGEITELVARLAAAATHQR